VPTQILRVDRLLEARESFGTSAILVTVLAEGEDLGSIG
jgi:hypothetical protein